MKNRILNTIVILFAFSFSLNAQDSHMALNVGPSIPLSDFAAVDNYKSNGYATPGFVLSFEGNYIPTWYFGVGGAVTFSTNYPNQDSMLNGLIQELQDMNGMPQIPDDVEADFSIDNWSYVNFLVGPTFAYPAGKVQFNLKALLGMSVVMTPAQTLTLVQDGRAVRATSDVQNFKFCYNVGADIILKLGGSYSLKFGAEYFNTKTNHSVDIGLDENTALPSINREFNLNALHTTVGLAYLF